MYQQEGGAEHDAGAGCKATHNEGVPVGDGGLSWLPSLGNAASPRP